MGIPEEKQRENGTGKSDTVMTDDFSKFISDINPQIRIFREYQEKQMPPSPPKSHCLWLYHVPTPKNQREKNL